jgi:hypothetical protein
MIRFQGFFRHRKVGLLNPLAEKTQVPVPLRVRIRLHGSKEGPHKAGNSRRIREQFSELQTVWRREWDSNPR